MAKVKCNPITISNCPPTSECDACKEILNSDCIKYNRQTLSSVLESLEDCCPYITFDVKISNIEILDLFNTPIEIAPAPGTGKYYRPVEAWGKVYPDDENSYVIDSGQVIIRFTGDSFNTVQFNNTFLIETENAVYSAQIGANKLLINTPLEVAVTDENPTQGKGTIHIFVKVAVETF